MVNLEECLFLGAAKLEKLYRRYFCEAFAEFHFSPNEIAVLVYLFQHAPACDTATDIAQGRGISKALVTRSVSTLAGRGFLAAERDARDRRVVHLRLTDSSRDIAARLNENRRRVAEQLQQGIPPDELAHVAQVIERMQRNLDALLEADERKENPE